MHATKEFLYLLGSGRTVIYGVYGCCNGFISISGYSIDQITEAIQPSMWGASRIACCIFWASDLTTKRGKRFVDLFF
jgi:hypothetical protein